MIKQIIHELIYLTKQDPGMREYNQGHKMVIILIMIIFVILSGLYYTI